MHRTGRLAITTGGLGLAALLALGCSAADHERKDEQAPNADGGGATEKATQMWRGDLRLGECWSHQDCLDQGDAANEMCSLQHVGRPLSPQPDRCTGDADCTGPRQRCVPTVGYRECTHPGRCEPCCKP